MARGSWRHALAVQAGTATAEVIPTARPAPLPRASGTAIEDRLTVLLVEDNPADARLIVETLPHDQFEVVHVPSLADATTRLGEGGIDAILLDLSLPDGVGADSIGWTLSVPPRTPVVVLTGLADETIAIQALRSGVQDYLVKGQLDGDVLPRTLRYALEREALLAEVDALRRHQLEAKDELLSHVSHELRTPLNAVYQFLTLVTDGIAGPLTSEQAEYLGIGLRNVHQLRTMISDLLEVTRLQGGSLVVVPEPTAVAPVVQDVLASLRSSALAKGVALDATPTPDLPAAYVDPQRLQQIVTNLVDNAVKFTPGGGRVVVSTARDTAAPDFIQVTVTDTGRGIAPEHVTKVFERFHQELGGTDTSRRGLGLGLYISQELVTRQGGRIWVESTPGSGSRFAFTVPVCEPNGDGRWHHGEGH
jgi:signal transduction histidine kinase